VITALDNKGGAEMATDEGAIYVTSNGARPPPPATLSGVGEAVRETQWQTHSGVGETVGDTVGDTPATPTHSTVALTCVCGAGGGEYSGADVARGGGGDGLGHAEPHRVLRDQRRLLLHRWVRRVVLSRASCVCVCVCAGKGGNTHSRGLGFAGSGRKQGRSRPCDAARTAIMWG
jgi:hypothetical protein